MLQMPWKQLDGQRVMKVNVRVGIGVVVGGSAEVVSGCDSDSDAVSPERDLENDSERRSEIDSDSVRVSLAVSESVSVRVTVADAVCDAVSVSVRLRLAVFFDLDSVMRCDSVRVFLDWLSLSEAESVSEADSVRDVDRVSLAVSDSDFELVAVSMAVSDSVAVRESERVSVRLSDTLRESCRVDESVSENELEADSEREDVLVTESEEPSVTVREKLCVFDGVSLAVCAGVFFDLESVMRREKDSVPFDHEAVADLSSVRVSLHDLLDELVRWIEPEKVGVSRVCDADSPAVGVCESVGSVLVTVSSHVRLPDAVRCGVLVSVGGGVRVLVRVLVGEAVIVGLRVGVLDSVSGREYEVSVSWCVRVFVRDSPAVAVYVVEPGLVELRVSLTESLAVVVSDPCAVSVLERVRWAVRESDDVRFVLVTDLGVFVYVAVSSSVQDAEALRFTVPELVLDLRDDETVGEVEMVLVRCTVNVKVRERRADSLFDLVSFFVAVGGGAALTDAHAIATAMTKTAATMLCHLGRQEPHGGAAARRLVARHV